MKINAINLRPGNAFYHEGRLLVVVKNEINQPGKGAAVSQIEARDAQSGLKTNLRFRTQEGLEAAEILEYDYNFLYSSDDVYYFMNNESFDQIEIPADTLSEQASFLQDGMTVSIRTHEGQPLSVRLPQKVVMEVVEADPVVKGQTAASSYKPARLENGVTVMVPPHIETGTRIVVNTEDLSYVERAKE